MDTDAALRSLDALAAREKQARSQLALVERRLLETEQRLARIGELELERDAARQDAAELRTRVEVLEADKATLEERVERSHRVHEEMTASLSWRVTAPLRAAKRIGGR